MRTLASLFAFSLLACAAPLTGADFQARFAAQTQCTDATTIIERPGGYELHGCGKHAFCGHGGYCSLYLTPAEIEDARQARLRAVRQSFVSDFGCTAKDTVLTQAGNDFIAEGCGAYARCSGANTILCVAEAKPTCEQLSRGRYDRCALTAAQQGVEARRYHFAPWPMNVANSIVGSIQANKSAQHCETTYRAELDQCARATAAR